MVAPTKVIAGLGASLGFDILLAPGATGELHIQGALYLSETFVRGKGAKAVWMMQERGGLQT